MRLIDANALHFKIADWQLILSETYGENDEYVRCLEDVLGMVDNAQTIDAVEVVHGKWLRYGEDGNPNSIDTCIWQCDKCLETYYGRTERIPNYCPNCGAIMDGERKDPNEK